MAPRSCTCCFRTRHSKTLHLPTSASLSACALCRKLCGPQGQVWLGTQTAYKTTFAKLDSAMSRCAGEHPSASKYLKKIFRGHASDARFMPGCDMVTDAMRASAVNGLPPADWASYGARCKGFVQFLQGYNWSVVSPWTFQHEHLHVCFSLDPALPAFPRSLSKLQNDLRESWRHFLYEGWRSGDRRDAQACAHIPYSSDRCT